MFPKVPDHHKKGQPLIPNGLGVLYVLFSSVYLFLVYFFGVDKTHINASAPLTLAVCILFGGFMGLLDDWMDLKWRYKAFMPLIAALPLIYFAIENPFTRTSIFLPFIGTIQFGSFYFFLIIPLIVMIVTNTINQLGGLNGLETICPVIVLFGLMVLSTQIFQFLIVGPLLVWLLLAFLNFNGKIFVGNTGSFAIGLTLASFAVMSDLKWSLVISIIPYIFNSALILLTVFFIGKKANVFFDGKKLSSTHRRSLITLLTYYKSLTEKKIVILVASIISLSTLIAVLLEFF